MRPEQFKSFRAGRPVFVSGAWHFLPNELPPEGFAWNRPETVKHLLRAQAALSALDAVLGRLRFDLPVDGYLALREAVFSTRIEGTRAGVRDAALFQAARGGSEVPVDVLEVLNQREAVERALELLKASGGSFTVFLLRLMHQTAMEGVRSPEFGVGEFKKRSNFSGGIRPETAEFVYAPPEQVPGLVENLVWFLNETDLPELVAAAVAHYQFEAVHPFPDGNGRVGRALVTVFLVARGLIKKPALPLSAVLYRRRDDYVDRLKAVSLKGDFEGWIDFFLEAVEAAAREAIGFVEEAERLVLNAERKLTEAGASEAFSVVLEVYRRLAVTVEELAGSLGLSARRVESLVKQAQELGLVGLEGSAATAAPLFELAEKPTAEEKRKNASETPRFGQSEVFDPDGNPRGGPNGGLPSP